MKNSIAKLVYCSTIACSLLMSCKEDKTSPSADSRNVKYEISGNAIGAYDATYITGSGSGANEIPTSLPWTKEIVFQSGVNNAVLNSAVSGATPGKTITSKIYVGGVLKKEETATVQSNGIAIIASLSYTLK